MKKILAIQLFFLGVLINFGYCEVVEQFAFTRRFPAQLSEQTVLNFTQVTNNNYVIILETPYGCGLDTNEFCVAGDYIKTIEVDDRRVWFVYGYKCVKHYNYIIYYYPTNILNELHGGKYIESSRQDKLAQVRWEGNYYCVLEDNQHPVVPAGKQMPFIVAQLNLGNKITNHDILSIWKKIPGNLPIKVIGNDANGTTVKTFVRYSPWYGVLYALSKTNNTWRLDAYQSAIE